MNEYLKWDEQIISDFSSENINRLYNDGYLFGRPEKGYMYQTRSLRIDLSKFELSSENRRILRKTEDLKLEINDTPYKNYSWEIGKLAKDFYDTKFGKGTFSANKVREILTTEHNFNKLFTFVIPTETTGGSEAEESLSYHAIGYAICFESNKILHYSYPFYELKNSKFKIQNLGMGMMLRAIDYTKKQNKKYIYLGSASRSTDTYKLQFKGLEWFDGEEWKDDLEELKDILKKQT